MQRELVERAQGGDADAFRVLVYQSAPRLHGIAYRILRDPARAEDALLQALIQMCALERVPNTTGVGRRHGSANRIRPGTAHV